MNSVLPDLLVHPADGHTIADPAEWSDKAADIRARMESIIGVMPEHTLPPDVKLVEQIVTPDYIRSRITYTVAPAERIYAYLLVPHTRTMSEPGPGLVCLHQTVACGRREPVGLEGSEDYAYAHHLASRGFVCVVPDHITAGDRVSEGLEPYDTAAFYERHPEWSAVGKSIHDTMRAVDVLLGLPGVDPARIGVIGHSLGGHSSIFAAAYDERIAACVSNCGLTTFAENPNRMDWCRDHWYVYLPALRPIFLANEEAPFDFHEVVSLVAPRALLNISSLTDAMVGSPHAMFELARNVREVYELLGHQSNAAFHFHDTGHGFTEDTRDLAYGWLERVLALS
jgi:dienelactone hydrolase